MEQTILLLLSLLSGAAIFAIGVWFGAKLSAGRFSGPIVPHKAVSYVRPEITPRAEEHAREAAMYNPFYDKEAYLSPVIPEPGVNRALDEARMKSIREAMSVGRPESIQVASKKPVTK